MAGAKEVRTKIASIKKTQKITKAMEMVAASKVRKTQLAMEASKPYSKKIYQVITHLARAQSEYRHSFMQKRQPKNIGLVVVTSDRGLCGGLNVNLLREALRAMTTWKKEGKEVKVGAVGRKAQAFYKRSGGVVLSSISHLGDKPSLNDLIGFVHVLLKAYEDGEIDELHVVYNQFINTMTQKPVTLQLLPLPTVSEAEKTLAHHWDYIYEPDAHQLLDTLLQRYIEIQLYQAVVENIACEQAAKMVAMKSATDNAGVLIKDLQLVYNKARQAAITQEISEIVGGADAL